MKEYIVKDSNSLEPLIKIDVSLNREGDPPSNIWVEDLGHFVLYSKESKCYLFDTDPYDWKTREQKF